MSQTPAIHPTAVVEAGAQLGAGVVVGPYAVVGAGVRLHDGVRVGAHAVLAGDTEIGPRTVIHPHAVLGGPPQDLKYRGGPTRLRIGADNVFREFTTASLGTEEGGGETRIGDGNLFMAYSHVAHDCRVGDRCVFANSVNLAGHVVVGDHAVIGGLVGIHQHARVGRCAMVGGGAMVAQDVPPFTLAQGDRARLYGLNLVGLRRLGLPAPTLSALRAAWRLVFQHDRRRRRAEVIEEARERYAAVPEVIELLDFVASSARGVCRAARG